MSVVAAGVWSLLDIDAAGLAGPAAANLSEVGVPHPVTAVLLGYRSMDTLLELGVLLAALVATWRLGLTREPFDRIAGMHVFPAYARVVIPALVVLAGVLLWRGTSTPGGAFQAGSALAAALLLSHLVRSAPALRESTMRLWAALGVIVFIASGLFAGTSTGAFLDWPTSLAPQLILAAATLAIGITLTLLVLGTHPDARGADRC